MSRTLNLGDTLVLPCRQCGQPSLRVVVKSAEGTESCKHCLGITKVTIRKDSIDWRVWTEAIQVSAVKAK